ncbi:MAG: DNA recombination protein RmuC [Phycisphaeraceae bacterium]|nr:MAG: DNA recombination protein RmuC [Phycisphaeraceae bacterium]
MGPCQGLHPRSANQSPHRQCCIILQGERVECSASLTSPKRERGSPRPGPPRGYTLPMLAAIVILSILVLALGALAAWLWAARTRTIAERDSLAREIETLHARLEEDSKRIEHMRDSFRSLAGEALQSSNEQFLALAKKTFEAERERSQAEIDKRRDAVDQLVKPIAETLKKTDEKLAALEKERGAAYAGLTEQVRAIAESNQYLRQETNKLVQALRKPQVRGRYGEIQLERVAEIAGMRSYCDFATQASSRDDDGRLLRPDMVVRLPNERVIAVDAKCNIEAYLDAIEAQTPEDADRHLDRFARHVADQAQALGKKEYWARFDGSAEFVVMFIPGDQFIDAALQRRGDLLELAAERGVIIASPSTLIGLLRAVHVGWREKSLSDSAQELFKLGRELHERAAVALDHADSLGKAIRATVERYNRFVGSVDSRLIPTLRKFEEGGAKSGRELSELPMVDVDVRAAEVPESLPAASAPESDKEDAKTGNATEA